jgi:hypothetical protein
MPCRCCHVLWDESSSIVYTEITKHPACANSHSIHSCHRHCHPSFHFSHKCYDYEYYKRYSYKHYKCYVGAIGDGGSWETVYMCNNLTQMQIISYQYL